MNVKCTVLTHRGLERATNEDCVAVAGWIRNTSMDEPKCFDLSCQQSSIVLAVADGLGGHASGEFASQFALFKVEALLGSRRSVQEVAVEQALHQVHRELVDLSSAVPAYRGMGTTIAGILLADGLITLFHVGDTRVYRREQHFLQLLTIDDRLHQPPYGEVFNDRGGSVLVQCLGAQTDFSEISPHVHVLPSSESPETLLLCTDGLYEMVSLDEMESCMTEGRAESVTNLFSKACNGGGRDNVTILVVEIAPQQHNSSDQGTKQ